MQVANWPLVLPETIVIYFRVLLLVLEHIGLQGGLEPLLSLLESRVPSVAIDFEGYFLALMKLPLTSRRVVELDVTILT